MKYAIFGCVMVSLLSLPPTPAQAELREWTSSDGKFKVEAELIGSDGQIAKLKREDGTTIDVPLAKLSDADRRFVEAKDDAVRPAEPAHETGDPPVIAPRAILKEHTKAVWCVAISPDGKLLATGGGNVKPGGNNPGELILWNLVTGKRIATLPSQGGRVRALAFSPDGKILAAGYEPENIITPGLTVLWNFPARTPKDRIPFEAHSLAFSSDGKLLALGGFEPPPPQGGRSSGGIKVWDVRQSRQTANLIGHSGSVESVVFSPDGRTIASASDDRTTILWDAHTGKLTTKLTEQLGTYPAIAISPDGTTLALGTQPKGSSVADEVTLLDLKTGMARLRIKVGKNVQVLAFSHNGKMLAAGTGWALDGEAILFDPADGNRIATLRGHHDVVKGVAFSPDDKILATGSTDGTVMLWGVSSKGLSEAGPKLPASPAGTATPAKPPTEKLPETPAGKTSSADLSTAKLPESVIKFQKSLESLRKLETVRLEKRLAELREPVRLGAKDAKNPVAREATALLRDMGTRLKVVKSGKPYVPRLSPKDFAVGQIGELDDDLLLSTQKVEGGVANILVMFEELSYTGGWSRGTVSRPDSFHVRAAFVAGLPPPGRDFDRASPANRLLRSHVYQVVDGKGFVLEPFKMDEVHAWLRDEAKRPKE